jgi:hypothetical protein
MVKEIDYIIENFDYDRVEKVMEVLDWTWAVHTDSPTRRPTIKEMQKVNRKYLEYCIEQADRKMLTSKKGKKGKYSTFIGGFEYTASVYADTEKIYLGMKFVATEFNNYE